MKISIYGISVKTQKLPMTSEAHANRQKMLYLRVKFFALSEA